MSKTEPMEMEREYYERKEWEAKHPVCKWCGGQHFPEECPKVAEIEYFELGGIKRVVFREEPPAVTIGR